MLKYIFIHMVSNPIERKLQKVPKIMQLVSMHFIVGASGKCAFCALRHCMFITCLTYMIKIDRKMAYVSHRLLFAVSTCKFIWRWRCNDGGSNHQPYDCLINCLFRHRWKKTSKLRVTGLCEGNSSVIGEFPTQRDSNVENVSIWWRHHEQIIPDESFNSLS